MLTLGRRHAPSHDKPSNPENSTLAHKHREALFSVRSILSNTPREMHVHWVTVSSRKCKSDHCRSALDMALARYHFWESEALLKMIIKIAQPTIACHSTCYSRPGLTIVAR